MATLTIKNVPKKLHQRLKESAAAHRRSVNSEVIARLERELMSRPLDPDEYLADVRQFHDRLAAKGVYVTEEILREAKKWGRP